MILVINAGSSSVKYKLFEFKNLHVIHSGIIEEIKNHHDAFIELEEIFRQKDIDFSHIKAIGHRVVHGGEIFDKPTLIDDDVIEAIKSLIPLAPLHNRANLEGIYASQNIDANIPNIAIFDTSFHQNIPPYAYRYALPKTLYKDLHVRKYGFHGTSHEYISKEASKILKKPLEKINIISLHVGNGVSACAIKNGKSIDTSMGMTPLDGLMMGTRSGSIDPAVILYLMRERGYNIDKIDTLLNKKSGLLGIAGESDMRKLLSSDTKDSRLAIEMFTYRLKKQIGEYLAVLGSVDALVFTGGIGENSKEIRELTCKGLKNFNLNVLVIKTDEELQIALHVKNYVNLSIL